MAGGGRILLGKKGRMSSHSGELLLLGYWGSYLGGSRGGLRGGGSGGGDGGGGGGGEGGGGGGGLGGCGGGGLYTSTCQAQCVKCIGSGSASSDIHFYSFAACQTILCINSEL